MTSNIGSQYLLDGIQDDGSISEEARNLVMQDLRAHFRPEFLNRLDETIMFKPLTKDNIGHIVDLLLKGLNKRLADQELTVELSPAAKQFVIEGGYDPVYGARPLKRFVQKEVETSTAKLILGGQVSEGDTILLESCEYCNSFLNFFPTTAVILDVDADHLDFFKDLADIQHSFRRFAQLVPANGQIVANGDDANTAEALRGMDYVTFGFRTENRVHWANVSPDWRTFDIVCDGKTYCRVSLGVRGRHNALNALAAAAVAWLYGIAPEAVERGLHEFTGAGRRLEYKGRFNGADIYDDYAHHPHELHALLETVKTMGYSRILCAFQPHTYSRTKALFKDFVAELRTVDVAILTDIYAARERNTTGITSQDLVNAIPGSVYCPSLPELTAWLRENAHPGDLILTVGAGDVYKAGNALLSDQ